jgi:hypothetical protein
VKILISILGVYLAVGWVMGMAALLRSRTKPLRLLDDLSPIQAAAAALALWPVVLLDEWTFRRMCRRLGEGPIRTDWVMTEIQIPNDWITQEVASDARAFDWGDGQYNPTDNPGLRELLALMTPGDELWKFSSSAESWRNLSGRAGYVVLRKGEQIAHLTTIMN